MEIRIACLVMGFVFLSSVGQAATIAASTCALADVQAAINIASDGDVVTIPAGTCTWSSGAGVHNKNIHVRGAGIDRTVIWHSAEFVFYVAAHSTGQFRLSDMTLTGSTTGAAILITSESSREIISGWRVDHIKFNYPSGQRNGIGIRGVTYGVIDHNEFVWSQGFAIHVAAFNANDDCTAENPMGNFINSQPLDLGTANAVYIEDNIFTSVGNGPIAAYDTSAGGARAVFRHNRVSGGFYYSHWTRGCEIGGIVNEIYRNTFIGNADWGAAGYPIRLESGTGVIFSNYLTGYGDAPFVYLDDRRAIGGGESSGLFGACDGTKAWDGNKGDPGAPGWPCLGQVGRSPGKSASAIMAGDKQVSAPIYVWNNGLKIGCATGGVCADVVKVFATPAAYVKATPHPNGDVDYVASDTPKPGYAPFVYPHPLSSGVPLPDPDPTPDPPPVELCNADGTGNGIDDDGDGTVDEGCTVPPPPSDTVPPSVTATVRQHGGSHNYTVTIEASDNVAIAQIALMQGSGVRAACSPNPPTPTATCEVQLALKQRGTYTYEAQAWDTSNNLASTPVEIRR